jgi:hypothetical protein
MKGIGGKTGEVSRGMGEGGVKVSIRENTRKVYPAGGPKEGKEVS